VSDGGGSLEEHAKMVLLDDFWWCPKQRGLIFLLWPIRFLANTSIIVEAEAAATTPDGWYHGSHGRVLH